MVGGPLGDVRDGRQSPAAFAICRGVARLLRAHGLAAISELALANGRRADVVAIADSGEIVRAAPEHKLAGARRKAMTLRLARSAALRLQGVIDPEGGFESLPG